MIRTVALEADDWAETLAERTLRLVTRAGASTEQRAEWAVVVHGEYDLLLLVKLGPSSLRAQSRRPERS